ncbi:DUF2681 domain-containing protein [Aggregatibacter actinomycetemcomitans]|uniref:DUF2681 domain-containing protein n=1 Tax=Aggregatibacter actinomycetemcomitans TaxID=714 RepID=UPI00197C72C1|nr:DUF2681 domain-containing protein [Aggregatibacter actinomycetemcomitans]MBN6074291.1 DUF2681 domain-containing protein [Aggregatibacter actinomycetemcomitans]
MNLFNILITAFGTALLLLWVLWRRAKAKTAELEQDKQKLETQNQVLQTRVNNQKERRKNEENANRSSRDGLIDSMRKSGDMRD